MALKLYYKNSSDEYVEASPTTGEAINPISTVHDGKNGDTQSLILYLKNDNSAKWYSNIVIVPYDLINSGIYDDVVYDETGWGVKLSYGGTEPTTYEWDEINWGESISMDNVGSDSLGDTATYYPFWYLVTCPPNTNAQNKTDIVLKLYYTENAVS